MEKRHKPKKLGITVLIFVLAGALLITGIGFFVFNHFRIKKINISGSNKYTYEELYQYIFADRNDKNIILFNITNRKNEMPQIPFIAQVDIDVVGTDTLDITVYDKSLIGYVVYKGTNMYFDKDGVVVESSSQVVPDVMEIRGLDYDSIVLYQKLEVGDEGIFKTLQDVTQYLDKYSIKPEAIVVDDSSKIDLLLGEVTVKLGSNDHNMSSKIYELSCMKEHLEGRKGVLHLEDYVDGTENITFIEKE